MEVMFWLCAVLIGYVYGGYPLLASFLARWQGVRVRRGACEPTVTVLTAARNERHSIAEAIRNKLEQDYPAELLEVIVVSDASDDGTDEIVRAIGDERVRLIRQEPQAGKTAALNLAAREAKGEILVFADANSIYAPDAIRRLAENFHDPGVAYVTGKMVYTNPDGSLVGDGCSAYMKYENWLRCRESRLGTVVGVDGGIDAMRRALYRPMRPDQQPDFVLPLSVAARGHRVVYDERALLKEPALSEHAAEYRMRVRVTLRALCALLDMRQLLSPLRYPMLSLQIWSHKVLRYLAFVLLVMLAVLNLWLWPQGGIYVATGAVQLLIYGVGAFAWLRRGETGRWTTWPYYFLLLNLSAAHAVVKLLRGERQVMWAPRTG